MLYQIFQPNWRDLIVNLLSKEIKVRYMGAALGFAWSLGNPLLVTITYLVVFTWIFPNNQDRFALRLATGMLHWSLFSQIAFMSCDWLVGNAHLLKKIYFPRIIIPVTGILTSLTFWLAALFVYAIMFWPLGGFISPALFSYVIIWLGFIALAFGMGLMLCIGHAIYRDLRHIVEVTFPVLFWLTPIIWDPNNLPPGILPILSWNPLFPYFSAFTMILHDGQWPDLANIAYCVGFGFAFMVLGLGVFVRQVHKIVELL